MGSSMALGQLAQVQRMDGQPVERSPWLTQNSTVVHHIDLSESLAYRSDLIPASRSIAVACLGLPIAQALALTLCLLLGMYGLLAITYPLGRPLDLLHFAVGPR